MATSSGLPLGQLRLGNLGLTTADAPPVILLLKSDGVALNGSLENLRQGDEVVLEHASGTIVYQAKFLLNAIELVRTAPGLMDQSFVRVLENHLENFVTFGPGGNVFAATSNYSLSDGEPIPTFQESFAGTVRTLSTFEGGRTLVGGLFTRMGNEFTSNLAMMVDENRIDPGFKANVKGWVNCAATDSEGRIVIGGNFTEVNGQAFSGLARLMPDGVLDQSFAWEGSAGSNFVSHVNILRSGRILVFGSFSNGGGAHTTGLRMLFSHGQRDTSFDVSFGSNNISLFTAEDNLGRILIGGEFSEIAGISQSNLARVSPTGAVDMSFRPVIGEKVSSIVVDAENRMLLGGRMVRLLPDGSVDDSISFEEIGNTDFPSSAQVAVHPDGSIFRSGFVNHLIFGNTDNRLVRYFNDGSSYQTFLQGNSTLVWQPSGGTPQPRRLWFEMLRNGKWQRIGGSAVFNGTRWETDLDGPPNGIAVRPILVLPGRVGESTLPGDASPLGQQVPSLISSPAAKNFGTAPAGFRNRQVLALTNDGNLPLTGLMATVTGGGAGSFEVATAFPVSLAPGGKTEIAVSFTAPLSGAASAVLRITANESEGFLREIPLSGSAGAGFSVRLDKAGDAPVVWEAGDFPQVVDMAITLGLRPTPGMILKVIDNRTDFAIPVRFPSVPEKAVVVLEFQGEFYEFVAGYSGADGNDLVLALLGEGAVDPAFEATGGWNWSLAKQADGKILVGSSFSKDLKKAVRRILPDGSPDLEFQGPDFGLSRRDSRAWIECIRLLDDGRIMVSGRFDLVDGFPRNNVARLLPNGDFDPSFDAGTTPGDDIRRMEVDSQGRVVLCASGIFRVLPDGARDPYPSFQGVSGGTPKSLLIQPDGKIVYGGHERLRRLLPDGEFDDTFQVQTGPVNGEDSRTYGLLYEEGMQGTPDKLIIAGAFTSVNGVRKPRIARLFTDGSLDPTFHADVDGTIACVSRQYNGCYIISGYFDSVGGKPRHGMARLLPDGSLDESFNPALRTGGTAITKLFTSVQLDDGSIIGAGSLERPGGFTSGLGIAKFLNGPASPGIRITNRTDIRFTLSPTSPDVRSVEMEYTRNAVDWVPLGRAVRDATGWSLNGASLPGYAYLRVRTRAQSGPRAFGISHSYQVIGRPQLPVEVWRERYFGSPLPQEASADEKDPDRDGVSNLTERGFGMNPIKADRERLPIWQTQEHGLSLDFSRAKLTEGFTMDVLWSETLEAGDWSPLSDSGDSLDFRFTLPQTPSGRAFGRFRVLEE